MSPLALGIGLGIPFQAQGGGGGAAASVNAVRFDGTNDWLEKATEPTGIADGPNFTWSQGIRFEGGNGVAQTLLCVGTFSTVESDLGLLIERTAANLIRAVGYTSLGVKVFDCITTGNTITADGSKHQIRVEVNGTACTITFDGTDVGTNTPGTAGDIQLTGKWQIGRHDDSANRNYLNASVGEIWFDDISLTLNSRFWKSSGSQFRDLGADGSDATGVQPPVYLSGDSSAFHTNLGSGGGFTLNGAVDDADNFGAVAAQEYAIAVDFPGGTSQGLDRGTSTLTNSSGASCSFWLRRDSTTSDIIFRAASFRKQIMSDASDTLTFFLRNPSNVIILDIATPTNSLVTGATWQHVAWYADMGTLDDVEVFIDGVSQSLTIATFTTSETIWHDDGGFPLGNQVALGSADGLDGGLAHFAYWPRKIDWSNSANLALVRTASGGAVPLPDDGDIDGNGAADFVMNKSLAYAHVNGGAGGNWVAAAGAMADIQGPPL